MRQPKEFDTADGKRWRVRFRSNGVETSRTFYVRQDAQTFAAILGNGSADAIAEALAWLAAKEAQHATETFGAYFTETFLRTLTGITPRTRADYEAMHRRYLTHLDPVPLPLITRVHVADLVNDLDRRLSGKTVQNVIHMLSSVFNRAIDDGLVDRNPCRRVRLPVNQLGSHEPRFLSHEEFGALVNAMPAQHRPFVTFLVGTGLRWSEATALPCRNVLLDKGTVRVDRAWKRIPGGHEVGPPKSPKSRRTVNAATLALAAAAPLMAGPDDLLFRTGSGNAYHHSNFYNRVWKPATAKAGLDARPHDLRHTHASWLISDGASLEAVQDQLGHESIETTRRVYSHLLPAVGVEVGRMASAALQRALGGEAFQLPSADRS